MTRGLIGLFLATLTGALVLAAATIIMSALKDDASDAGHGSKSRERVFAVNVSRIEPITTIPVVETYGEVISGRTLEIRAASNGTLVQMSENFREGGEVQEGDLLFQTDPSTAFANAQLAQTELDEAKAELAEANDALGLANDELRASVHQYDLHQQVLARQKSLRDRGVGTETAMETAALSAASSERETLTMRQSLANAKARINRAKIALSRSNINFEEANRILADTSVYAKFDGVLSEIEGNLGGLVNANERMGSLIDPNALEVSFRVSNAEFNRIVGGVNPLGQSKVFVTFDGVSSPVLATLDRVSADVGEGQTGRELYASLKSAQVTTARPGDFVSVTLEELPLNNVAILPATAMSSTQEVLVLDDDDRLTAQTVEVLRKQGEEIIVAIGSLSGREVVMERAPQLGVGVKVEPRRITDRVGG